MTDYPYSLLAKDHVNDWLREPLSNYRVVVHHGAAEKPKWYDFPRRLGWRAKKRVDLVNMRGNQVLIDRMNKVIYCTPAMEGTLRRSLPDSHFLPLI